jgi:hypothetical protein
VDLELKDEVDKMENKSERKKKTRDSRWRNADRPARYPCPEREKLKTNTIPLTLSLGDIAMREILRYELRDCHPVLSDKKHVGIRG